MKKYSISNISELIDKMDDGINTLLGKEFGGVDLSGGEYAKLYRIQSEKYIALNKSNIHKDI